MLLNFSEPNYYKLIFYMYVSYMFNFVVLFSYNFLERNMLFCEINIIVYNYM